MRFEEKSAIFLMWSILCILKSECDSDSFTETNLANLSNYPIWCPANLFFDGFNLGYNNLIFDFILENQGRIFIKSVKIPTGRFNYSSFPNVINSSILEIEGASITYKAYKYREHGYNQLGQIRISSISLKHDIESLIKPSDGDRVTCLINNIYLSRPQEIRGKIYYWKSGAEIFSPEHLQIDNSDLSLINMKLGKIYPNCVPDTSPNFKLPIFFQETEKPLIFRFYNFKYTPPRKIHEITIKWSEFMKFVRFIQYEPVETKRGIMKRKLPSPRSVQTSLLEKENVYIHFILLNDSKIEITLLYIRLPDDIPK